MTASFLLTSWPILHKIFTRNSYGLMDKRQESSERLWFEFTLESKITWRKNEKEKNSFLFRVFLLLMLYLDTLMLIKLITSCMYNGKFSESFWMLNSFIILKFTNNLWDDWTLLMIASFILLKIATIIGFEPIFCSEIFNLQILKIY